MEDLDFVKAMSTQTLGVRLDDHRGKIMWIEREGQAGHPLAFADAESEVRAVFAARTEPVFGAIRNYRTATRTAWEPSPGGPLAMIAQGVAQIATETALWLDVAACHEALAWRRRQYEHLLRAWRMADAAPVWSVYRRRLGKRARCACASLRVWWNTASWSKCPPADDDLLRNELRWIAEITTQRAAIARQYEAHRARRGSAPPHTETASHKARAPTAPGSGANVSPERVLHGLEEHEPGRHDAESEATSPSSSAVAPTRTPSSADRVDRSTHCSLCAADADDDGDSDRYSKDGRDNGVIRQTNAFADALLIGTLAIGAAAIVSRRYRGKMLD